MLAAMLRDPLGPESLGQRGVELVLVRHGSTPWSTAGRHTGRTDLCLDEEGEKQARALAGRLGGESFSRVLSSPRRRALDTCRLAGFGDRVEVEPLAVEWDYGAYEGKTTAEITASRPGWSLFDDGCPEGESVAAVGSRADRLLGEVARGSSTAGSRILVFAHGHILRVLAARWLGLAPGAGRYFILGPASLSRLGSEHGSPAMASWNC